MTVWLNNRGELEQITLARLAAAQESASAAQLQAAVHDCLQLSCRLNEAADQPPPEKGD